MRTYLFILAFAASTFAACNKTNEKQQNPEQVLKIPEVKEGAYFTSVSDSGQSLVIAPTITYDVIIKNPDLQDQWTTECLEELDLEALHTVIFNAIYNGRLEPLDYNTEQPISLKEVKAFEKAYSRNKIGKMQFVEAWYFNENTLEFGKQVRAIMLAYELHNSEGHVRGYKAGIKVFLPQTKTHRPAI